MKVKDIINKCKFIDTKFIFFENGKEIDRKDFKDIKPDYYLMNRTLNSWELGQDFTSKEPIMVIWVKPLD
jgi:hypothetical protein